MTEELKAMGYDELLAQAEVFGIEAEGLSEEELRDAIGEKLGVESNAPRKKNTRKRKAPGNQPADYVRVVVEESDSDRQPAYVGLNGRSYRIKRGVEVEVPRGVAQILLTAKQKVRSADGTEREVPTYPTRIVSEAA
jgi:hypothetical protein